MADREQIFPTLIEFSGLNDDYLAVREDAEAVFGALAAAGGLPFALTDLTDRKVYVNPGRIAFWRQSTKPFPP